MDVPATVLFATILAYWLGVGIMIVRVRRHARRHERRDAEVMPKQPLERLMGLVWIPVVTGWIALPWLSLSHDVPLLSLPDFTHQLPWYAALRWIAAVVAVACLAATVKSWSRMGSRWRMAVTDEPGQVLITDGMFARIRHPIYAFSILLMVCTMIVVPTLPMLVLGAIHIGLMVIKARNEERFLLARHGAAYADYVARTGRFVPRLR